MNDGVLTGPASGRCRAYRDLAVLFRYPGEDLNHLARGDVLGRDFLDWSEEVEEGAGASAPRLARALASQLRDPSLEGLAFERLESEFGSAFGHSVSKDCPPYETHFGCAHVYQQAEGLADIAGFYRAFGLEVAEEGRERPDHIALELEFMHFLTFKEEYAREWHGEEKAVLCREAQRAFMENHLGRWAPSFLRLLARKAKGTIYERVADLGLAFLEGEAGFLGVRLPDEMQEISAAGELDESILPCAGAEFCGGLEGRER